MDLGLYLPLIKSKGRYEINGQVLLFPIASHGEFYAEFSKISDLTSTRKCFQTLQCRLTAFYGDRRNRLSVDRRFFYLSSRHQRHRQDLRQADNEEQRGVHDDREDGCGFRDERRAFQSQRHGTGKVIE